MVCTSFGPQPLFSKCSSDYYRAASPHGELLSASLMYLNYVMQHGLQEKNSSLQPQK